VKQNNKFKIIFLFLLSYLIIQPLISDKLVIIDNIFLLGLVVIFLLSPYLLGKNRKWLVFGLATASVKLFSLIYKNVNTIVDNSSGVFECVAYFIVILYVFNYIISQEEITSDLIYASLYGYFLLAIGFAHTYNVLYGFGLVEFTSLAGLDQEQVEWDFMYYSFTTLTTLGYGDITPVSDLAKRLSGIEAAIGVLYVAVFIGRLIGSSNIFYRERMINNINTNQSEKL